MLEVIIFHNCLEKEEIDKSITYQVHSCARGTLLNIDTNTAPSPDNHTFRHFDMDSQCTPRSLRERKRNNNIIRIDYSKCAKPVHLPSLSISQKAIIGLFPDSIVSNQYRPLGASPPELFLISWHEAAGSLEREPRVAFITSKTNKSDC